jgi:Kef-type K+ transport system membrane component KefB
MTDGQLSVLFFVQMALILATCRLLGWLNRRFFGQPQVVGEMIAGILLGPSLFGMLLPHYQQLIFPAQSLKTLYVAAQLGVGLFMFLVGLEFRIEVFLARSRTAAAVSLAGMLVPFALAALLAPWLVHIPGLFSEKATVFVAVLFLGAAMSITAFPVLARIIYESGLTNTVLGALALSAGAVNDAAAWCVLAVVLASFGDGPAGAIKAIAGGVLYASVILTAGKWLLGWLARACGSGGRLSHSMLGLVLALLMICMSITDSLGIHAIFGGFLLGVAMPRGWLARELQAKLEPLVVVFLLPIFFTYSGLSTRLDVMSGGVFPLVALVILSASILGKGVACSVAARLTGENTRMALALGSLMNARGLMELIIVNIGLHRGVIQPALFSILVLMTVVTTLMASPLFRWFYGEHTGSYEKLQPKLLGE